MSNFNEVTLSFDRWADLVEAEELLNALRDAGVDNWEGYGVALRSIRGGEDE